MSAILQVGNQQIAADQFVSLLTSSRLLPQLLREFFVEQAIATVDYTPAELESYCQQLVQKPENYGVSPQEIHAIAPRQLQLAKFKEEKWGTQIESTFLNCREQLDRVLFSLIQSEEVEVIQELYFRLQEGEASFAKLATQYSQGPEAHSNGLVGPIELNNLHPKLAQVLRVSQPGQISPPIRVEKWLTIVRLERYIPAQLDEKMRQRLLDEMFEAWLQERLAQHSGPVHLDGSAELPPLTFEDEILSGETEELEGEVEMKAQSLPSPSPSENPARALPPQPKKLTLKSAAGTLALCLIPFGLGVLTVKGLASLTAQNVSPTPENSAASPGSTAAEVPEKEAFRVAVNHAMRAATLTQSAQSAEDWQRVSSHWKDAIALMDRVPSDSADSEVASSKAVEYQQYLDYAQQRAGMSVNAFREAVNNAMSAANLTQSAQSVAEWETVVGRWQKAVELMQAVPSDHPKYELAQTKAVEYQQNLEYAQSRVLL